MGAKLADPTREVYVFLGDGTYLMMPTEIVTSVQEGIKIIIVLVDNHGFASIGGLSRSLGQGGFGTSYRLRSKESGQLDGDCLTVDYVANARSLGAHALQAGTLAELKEALREGQDAGPDHGDRGGNRPGGFACRVTNPGGTWRSPKSRRWPACGNRGPGMKRPARTNGITCERKRECMAKLLVGNAPCSWGTLEFDAAKGEQIPFDRMLDELADTGYTGTELGDWAYMPTDPAG